MRLILVMLARNEADVIEHSLNWHLASGVDHAIVLDHESTDATSDILADLARTGQVTHIRRGGLFAQSKMTTELVQLAIQRGADWVIPCDADEFWAFGDRSLKEPIMACPYNVVRVPTFNFICTKRDDPAETNPVLRMRHQVTRPPNLPKIPYVLKPCQTKVMFNVAGFRGIAEGNHDVEMDNIRPGRIDGMRINHYPLRGWEHFHSKVSKGGAALAANKSLAPDIGYHWRRWHRLLLAGKLEKEWSRQNLGRWRISLLQALGTLERVDAVAERYLRMIEARPLEVETPSAEAVEARNW